MQELSIKVSIADRHYPLKIRESDEENVRKASRKINERLRDYVENFAVADKQDALAMIALEFAAELLSEVDTKQVADSDSVRLVAEIEQQLSRIVSGT